MPAGVLTGVGSYLRIEEDGSPIAMNTEPDTDDYEMIECGTLEIIRFVPFSEDTAKKVGGKGRWERLTVESSTEEEESEEEEDSGTEKESAVVWETDWEPLK